MPAEYRWFIEPKDDYSDPYIRDTLEHFGFDTDLLHPTCVDGQQRPMYECDRRVISTLKRSHTRLSYKVWVKEGSGKVEESFVDRKTPKKKIVEKTAVHEKPTKTA